MGNAVAYRGVAFMKAINAKKSFNDFYEHEKHHGFSRKEFKEVHDFIRKDMGMEPDDDIEQEIKFTDDLE